MYACHAANAYGADSKKIEVSGEFDIDGNDENGDDDDDNDDYDADDDDDNDGDDSQER